MTQSRRVPVPFSRLLRTVVAVSIVVVGLAGCSSESTPETADDRTQQSQEQAGGDDSDAEAASGGEGDVDQGCVEALAAFGLIEGALRVRAEQGPLDEQDVEETFGDFDAYADDLPAEVQADYQTYHEAVVGAIGLEDADVDAVLDAAEVQDAIGGLTQMTMMPACMSG